MFIRFKDDDGKFKKGLCDDVKGLMSFYEASQLIMEEEDRLDEAKDFSEPILNKLSTHHTHPEAKLVMKTLMLPHHKSLARFTRKQFLKNYQATNQWIMEMQELSKLDSVIVQSTHRNELSQVSKWWNELGLLKELKFARDQPVKWYMWSMAMVEDLSLSEQRVDLTKPISMVYIIDNIFDVHGTIDELILFTDVVNRWDHASVEQLPDYMKACFKALDSITNEISYKIMKKHGWNPIDTLRKRWATLCDAFLAEAKWFASGQLPKADEYLENGIVSTGVHVVLAHLFFLLGDNITEESVELLNDNFSSIIYSTAKILRLWDDLGSAKDENQDGQDGSYLDYYMKERGGISAEDARKHVTDMISDTWKRLNQRSFSPNPFSTSFIKYTLNAARMVPLMYSYDENQSLPELEEQLNSLLNDSFSSQVL